MEKDKIAIITGAYGAIGKAIATKIAQQSQYKVVLVGRNKLKLVNAVAEIESVTGKDTVEFRVLDLSLKSDIIELTKSWNQPLDLLINNAATTPRKRTETQEGVEVQWATNVLGYFHMINNMYKYMEGREDPRIVNVASYWAGGLYIDDVEFRNRVYDNDDAYRQSKQADRMLTVAFASRLMDRGISVNACHPGDVNSKLSNDLGFGGHESPDKGASTPVWLAMSNEVKGISGGYFEHHRKVNCKFSTDKTKIEELFELCSAY